MAGCFCAMQLTWPLYVFTTISMITSHFEEVSQANTSLGGVSETIPVDREIAKSVLTVDLVVTDTLSHGVDGVTQQVVAVAAGIFIPGFAERQRVQLVLWK